MAVAILYKGKNWERGGGHGSPVRLDGKTESPVRLDGSDVRTGESREQ